MLRKFARSDYLLPLVCLLMCMAWSAVLPVSQSPDESMRLAVPLSILKNGCLPNGYDPLIRDSIWGVSYAFTPYGSSLFAVPFMWVASLFAPSNLNAMYFAARLTSNLSAAGTVLFAMKTGRLLFSKDRTTCLLGILCTFLPQLFFIGSYFNCDAFSGFAASIIIYAWVKGLRTFWDTRSCVLLGVGVGLCSLSYYFAYGLIPLSVLFFFISYIRLSRGSDEGGLVGTCLKKALSVFLVAFLIGGWFFIWNGYLYGASDFLGMKAYDISGELYAPDAYKPSVLPTPLNTGMTPWTMLFEPFQSLYWLSWTMKSSLAFFGYMDILQPQWVYRLYYAFFLVGIIFSPAYIPLLKTPQRSLLISFFVASLLIPFLFSVYRSFTIVYQPQGRYLISALVPMMVILCCGFEGIDTLVRKRAKGQGAKHSVARGSLVSRICCAPFFAGLLYLVLFAYIVMTCVLPRCTQGIGYSYSSDTPITMLTDS